MMRASTRTRTTKETDIALTLCLDGRGESTVDTGIGFFDHMLTLFARHGGFDLDLRATGDLKTDAHHTVEDVGLVLGDALNQALGDRNATARYGTAYVPMDEALVRTVIDLSGRPYCGCHVSVRAKKLGEFDTELLPEFLTAFATRGKFAIHVDLIHGRNSHHIIEAVFKSMGRSLHDAVTQTGDGPLSTKGTLTA